MIKIYESLKNNRIEDKEIIIKGKPGLFDKFYDLLYNIWNGNLPPWPTDVLEILK